MADIDSPRTSAGPESPAPSFRDERSTSTETGSGESRTMPPLFSFLGGDDAEPTFRRLLSSAFRSSGLLHTFDRGRADIVIDIARPSIGELSAVASVTEPRRAQRTDDDLGVTGPVYTRISLSPIPGGATVTTERCDRSTFVLGDGRELAHAVARELVALAVARGHGRQDASDSVSRSQSSGDAGMLAAEIHRRPITTTAPGGARAPDATLTRA